jgi:hypothetical protein
MRYIRNKAVLLLFVILLGCDRDSDKLTGTVPPEEPVLKVLNDYPYWFESFEFPKDSMIIANVGTGNLIWSYSTNVPWLHLIPPSGINDDTIIFEINWNSLPTQGIHSGNIRFFTNVDSTKWAVHAENINPDIQITLSNFYVPEVPDSNDFLGYECYASFNRRVERLESYFQSSSKYLNEFVLSIEAQDSLLSTFNEIDFLNLSPAIPNPLSGIYYPCDQSTIRYRNDITKKFKTILVSHNQSPSKYPPGFLEFYDTISRILRCPN